MAQPDIPALLAGMNVVTAGLNSVAHEVARIPNIPALAGGAQIQATLVAIQASLNALTNTVNNNHAATQQTLAQIQA